MTTRRRRNRHLFLTTDEQLALGGCLLIGSGLLGVIIGATLAMLGVGA